MGVGLFGFYHVVPVGTLQDFHKFNLLSHEPLEHGSLGVSTGSTIHLLPDFTKLYDLHFHIYIITIIKLASLWGLNEVCVYVCIYSAYQL